MALTKEQRDALPAEDFAVPAKRALPIHDAKHVAMAWDMVDRTKDLTDAERSDARTRIKEQAEKLGVDTSKWSSLKAMALEAMSLQVPETEDHPNKMPFTGVLTRLDQPSDVAPNGSGGRRVVLPKSVAEKALPSLLGMAVDLTVGLNGHDAQNKVGLITEADIDGDKITIAGFIYAADFPDAAADIRAKKDILGFSFEMKKVLVADPTADPLVIEDCVFTGAAILKKADAAYQTTSLAASKDRQEIFDMTNEELQAALAAALKPITDKVEAIEAGQKKVAEDLAAGKETHTKIKPHADALRACSAAMEAAGVGGHATRGPAALMNRMADRMEAEAMVGKLPHIYRDHDFFVDASADKNEGESDEVKGLKDMIAGLETKITDLSKREFNASGEPERKSVSADATALLSKFGLQAGSDGKLTVSAVDTALEAAGVTGTKAIEAKLKLQNAGLLG
jgi:hypothetical protein